MAVLKYRDPATGLWTALPAIEGPAGPAGAPGANGANGANGATGPTGPMGAGTDEVHIANDAPTDANIELWVDPDDPTGYGAAAFNVLETMTTNTSIAIAAADWGARLPNTWSNGSTLSFTLDRPALIRFEYGGWLRVQGAAIGDAIGFGCAVDGKTPDVSRKPGAFAKVVYVALQTPNIDQQFGNSKTLELPAGPHTAEIQAYKTPRATGKWYLNYAALTASFLRYT